MRIALVTESFHPAADGATTTVRSIVDRLVDTGHDVLIVAPTPGPSTYRGRRAVRVTPGLTGLRKPGREVRDALADFAPDLVHVTNAGAVGRKALKQARRLGVPTLTVQQSVIAEASDYWRLKVADRSDRLLVTCEWMQGRLDELGVTAPVWTPGVDVDGFGPQLRDEELHASWARSRSVDGGRVVVGYVGNLRRGNDVRRLPEVAEAPGVRLVVIGDGPQKPWLRMHVPGARFLGAPSRSELAIAMASLDVLVHPGTVETSCHTLREAAASGVPVIAPATGGALEAVRHEEGGLLYDPSSYFGLRDAVTRLAGDPWRRALMGREARSVAVRRDWATAVDELVRHHYLPLLEGERAHRVA
ncbi:putative GDP-mannose-dependent alpha-mannosyltransferase [metagenome]|uniref:Putative GDP-mannose-dependent alpha-mannosyltransferase n=1 Tax=metagenome TaxID=256318 RepID=A0A2P2CE65_9ZZZZ